MYFATKICLGTILISFLNSSLACTICVNEPLLTSSVKCPICETCGLQTGASSNKFNSRFQSTIQRNDKCAGFDEKITCDRNARYRTIDGTCNNLKNPSWGKSVSAFVRLIPSIYGDKNSSIALASNGEPLPLARKIRTDLFPEKEAVDEEHTLIAMQWGQVVAHDITISLPTDDTINCCDQSLMDYGHRCLPLKIPSEDTHYPKYGINCIGEIRTQQTQGSCCKKRNIEQVNNNTHMMDASLVYGSDIGTANSLREFKNGRLLTQSFGDNREFLPQVEGPIENGCYIKNLSEPCYRGGDARINQNTELTVLQTILLREHNQIARKLQSMHRSWDDEKLYQESRNILISMLQHITYKEFLPIYIGEEKMRKHDLYPKEFGYARYNCKIKPEIINSFATSAFRFPHSGIQGTLKMFNYNRSYANSVQISDFTNRPCMIPQSQNYDQFLLGLTTQKMENFDRFYSEEITNLLFHFYSPFGHDLLSLDIQRGRDHALAPYVQYLEVCTGYKARTFEDLYRYIPEKSVKQLKSIYKSVQDIDLHIGGILENLVKSTKFGPTFLCIITEQFYRLKFGDRFWYENKNQPHSFTPGQLQEIRKVTLSRLICDNSDNITTIGRNSFRPISERNPAVSCDQIPSINFNLWR